MGFFSNLMQIGDMNALIKEAEYQIDVIDIVAAGRNNRLDLYSEQQELARLLDNIETLHRNNSIAASASYSFKGKKFLLRELLPIIERKADGANLPDKINTMNPNEDALLEKIASINRRMKIIRDLIVYYGDCLNMTNAPLIKPLYKDCSQIFSDYKQLKTKALRDYEVDLYNFCGVFCWNGEKVPVTLWEEYWGNMDRMLSEDYARKGF